jgi:ribonuclease HI
LAAIRAIECIGSNVDVKIFTDSKYLIKGMWGYEGLMLRADRVCLEVEEEWVEN